MIFAAAAVLPSWLSPSVALGLLTAGLLSIYVECNRPGRVLPGALGLLLSLLGVHGLSVVQIRPWSLLLLGTSLLLLLGELTRASNGRSSQQPPASWGLSLAAGSLLSAAVFFLPSDPATIDGRVRLACALLLGPSTAFLTHIAGQARRGKRALTHADPLGRIDWKQPARDLPRAQGDRKF